MEGGLGGGRPQPWTRPQAGVTLESTLLATGIPLLLQSAFLLCLTCFMVMGVKRAVGILEPLCVLVLCP